MSRNSSMMSFWIAVGAGLGGLFRFWCNEAAAHALGVGFPWGILIVNVIGSFVIGIFFTLTEPNARFDVSATARQFVMVGLCGGYTTFSAFSLDTLNLLEHGRILAAGAYVVLSVVLCLLFVWVGHSFASMLNPPRKS